MEDSVMEFPEEYTCYCNLFHDDNFTVIKIANYIKLKLNILEKFFVVV